MSPAPFPTPSIPPPMDRARRPALIIGVLALALCFLGGLFNRTQAFQSYLFAFLFFSSLSLGSLALLMLHQLVGGAWGWAIRRPLEAAAGVLPLVLVLFVPLAFGLPELYRWARPEAVADSAKLLHAQPYLNVSFFLIRAAVYLIAWAVLAWLFNRWSSQQAQTQDPAADRRLTRLSAGGLIVLGLSATFSAIDWAMSLDPEWQSTAFGALYSIGAMLGALAWAIVVTALLARHGPRTAFGDEVPSPLRDQFNDLGNLLLAFVLGWIYVAFMQYLVIWSGDLPHYIVWYLHRSHGGWQWTVWFVIVLQVALPFLVLLSREAKRSARVLMAVAASVLVAHWMHVFWLVAPALHPARFSLHWLDLAASVGIGGLWVALFLRGLADRSALPVPVLGPEQERLGEEQKLG